MTSEISPGFLFVRLSRRCRSRQHPPGPYGSKGRGATEAARRTLSFPSDATIGETKFAALLNFSANAPSLFRIPLHRTVSPTIAHAGDRGSASSRIALPKPSRVDELPISAHSKYGAKYLDLQCLFWSFFDSRKSPVKACESGNRRHRQQDVHPPDHCS